MRILVTGANGFIGQYLVRLLADRGHQVYAGVRRPFTFGRSDIEQVHLDMLDSGQIEQALRHSRPESIVHLAAQSNVRLSWENPAQTMQVNTIGAVRLLNAIHSVCSNAKLISIGSGEEYGTSPLHVGPLTEESACAPRNPYAISKFAAGQLLLQLALKDRLNVIHARPFNHIGPGQSEGFVVADIASQIARMEKGLLEPTLKVGNLSVRRDFTDVRDIAEAYVCLVEEKTESGIYNVCSMAAREISEILNGLIGLSKIRITVAVDSGKDRPLDIPVFVGSSEKLRNAVGWVPKRGLEQSLSDTLEWWRTHA